VHLVQILLPIAGNDGRAFPDDLLRGIQKELCDRFGGLTAYNRTPAEGIWRGSGWHRKEDIIVVEVMDDDFDRAWWENFRKRTERLLQQEELVVRAQAAERL
jgi:hypothetical protein